MDQFQISYITAADANDWARRLSTEELNWQRLQTDKHSKSVLMALWREAKRRAKTDA